MASTEKVKVSAVDIKKLWYFDPSKVTADLTGSAVYSLINASDTKEVKNIHQDTWSFEESDASQTFYKNQLTGSNYRGGTKQMGDVVINFTIGQYDYETKAAFLGGEANGNSWKRARGPVEIIYGFVALTRDDQYIVCPKCNVQGREGNTDGAIGIPVVATEFEPDNEEVAAEYWFDSSEVAAGS